MMLRVAAAIAILSFEVLAQAPATCSISGTVVDGVTGKPVERARVIAEVRGSYSLIKLLDEKGGFCFENLPPNPYRVSVQKAGYQEMVHPVTLAVEADTVIPPLALRMDRYATLSGAVLDSEGEPVPGAEVKIWERVRDGNEWTASEVERTSADASGAFHMSAIEPGTYYLSVSPPDAGFHRFTIPFMDSAGQVPRETEVETFYASSTSFDKATPLELKAGQSADHLVLTLGKARLRIVSGHVDNAPQSSFVTYSGATATGTARGGAIPIGKDGSFVQMGILPGRYQLELRDGKRSIARKEVDLTDGDASGVVLDRIETVDLPVVFRTEGKGPAYRVLRPGGVVLVRENSDDAAVPQADGGAYQFSGIERAVYRLHVDMGGQKLYLKNVSYGGETQTGNKVDLRNPRPGTLELTFSPNLAQLQGRVAEPGDEVTVILVDETQDIALETSVDQKGRFQMATVPPGKYRLFAIAGFNDGQWGSADLVKALAAKSVELVLKESEKKQVSVTAISADEWHAAVKRSGG